MFKLSPNPVLLLLAITAGGCTCGFSTKRAQEQCCPTDIRKTHWMWPGEDAIFHLPCGPEEAYHGHKATCWRTWQAPAAVWRDEHCGSPVPGTYPPGGCHPGTPVSPEPIPAETFEPVQPALPLAPPMETSLTPGPSGELTQPPIEKQLQPPRKLVSPTPELDFATRQAAPTKASGYPNATGFIRTGGMARGEQLFPLDQTQGRRLPPVTGFEVTR